MKIHKATHKAYLYSLFLVTKYPQERKVPKQFPIEKLNIASSVAKKLTDKAVITEENIQFIDNKIEFTAEEWVFLKELFNEQSTATIVNADIRMELKDLFEKIK